MTRTFAEDLLQFAHTVDIVNAEIFEQARGMVERYVKEALNIDYFEFMRETIVGGNPGLETVWATAQKHSEQIKASEDCYTNQICFTYGERTPLWVVCQDKSPLSASETYVDLWSGKDSLPKYEVPGEGYEMRTAIMVPLKRKGGSVLGVLDFESSEYLDITDAAKTELLLISEALCLLSERQSTMESDTADTKIALRKLEDSFDSKYLLRTPKLFFAWPARADLAVVALTRTVLDEFSNRVTIVVWDEIEDSGNINDQIVQHILSSTYGVCYFSEMASEGADTRYRDNANVLIEAGMLHVLSQDDESSARGWIPIREDEPPIPFDFVAQRTLLVPRLQNGELNGKRFEEQLRRRMENLLNSK